MDDGYKHLIVLEINSYLKKIYSKLGKKVKLSSHQIRTDDVRIKKDSFTASRMWEFKLNSRELAAKGDVGKIVVFSKGLDDDIVRKQRALFIASEFYVYHAFAHNLDSKDYSQLYHKNRFMSFFRRVLGKEDAHTLLDKAVQYIVHEIGQHKLARTRAKGWYVGMTTLKKHHPKIAKAIGSSEKAFKEILAKKDAVYDESMLKHEKELLTKEIEDIEHIDSLLLLQQKRNHDKDSKRLIKIHRDNLKTFLNALKKVMNNFDKWYVTDKGLDKIPFKISDEKIHEFALAQSEAGKIDMNKVYLVCKYFQKEKINILRDLELLNNVKL